MTVFTEGRHPAEFIISEEEMSYSRDVVTVASGAGVIVPGMVLGMVTATGKYVPSAPVAAQNDDGSGTATVVAVYGCDATNAEVANVVVIARNAVLNKNRLAYAATVDTAPEIAAKIAELKAKGILAR